MLVQDEGFLVPISKLADQVRTVLLALLLSVLSVLIAFAQLASLLCSNSGEPKSDRFVKLLFIHVVGFGIFLGSVIFFYEWLQVPVGTPPDKIFFYGWREVPVGVPAILLGGGSFSLAWLIFAWEVVSYFEAEDSEHIEKKWDAWIDNTLNVQPSNNIIQDLNIDNSNVPISVESLLRKSEIEEQSEIYRRHICSTLSSAKNFILPILTSGVVMGVPLMMLGNGIGSLVLPAFLFLGIYGAWQIFIGVLRFLKYMEYKYFALVLLEKHILPAVKNSPKRICLIAMAMFGVLQIGFGLWHIIKVKIGI